MAWRQQHHARAIASVLLLSLVAAGVLLSSRPQPLRLDLLIYDTLLPLQASPFSEQIALIAVDEASLQTLGRWPWDRQLHARLLETLQPMRPRVVGIDLLLPEPQRTNPAADRQLADALALLPSVLAVASAHPPSGAPVEEILPLPLLATSAAALGHVDLDLGSDGLCRSVDLYAGLYEARWPTLALAMLQVAGDRPHARRPDPGDGQAHWRRQQPMLIPYAAPGARPTTYSYADVLAGLVPADAFRDRYVLVGATAAGLGDAISTPLADSRHRLTGVELHAQILNGLLLGDGIRELPPAGRSLLTASLVLLLSLATLYLPLRQGLLLAVFAIPLPAALSATLLAGWHTWYAPTPAILMVGLAWPAWAAWRLGVEARTLREMQQRIRHLASHHIATDLPNQHQLENRLHALLDSTRSGRPAGLLVLHVNWPGSAGSILGKPMSESLLRRIAGRLQAAVSAHAFVAHLSGDDFAVLFDHLPDQGAVCEAASDLLQALQVPMHIDQGEVILTPRVGVSIWPDDGHDPFTLLRNAYTAMFKSRIDGTDLLCLYSADLGQELQTRLRVEQALLHALERDEFEVHYQPQLDAHSHRMVGVEALLRWHNPQLGWVSPATFIPVSEHVGLIADIGRWVLHTACCQLRAWHDAGLGPLRLAVNVSPLQFAARSLANDICGVVDRVGIDPADLELEITENALVQDLDGAVGAMRLLKRHGIGLAIDDFGTGYSSLSSLRHFPLDRIKIDQSFTRELGNNRGATEITQAIVDMGKRLGLRVIAEGVETEHQAQLLRAYGCDELQGFLFDRPLPANEIGQRLQRQAGSA